MRYLADILTLSRLLLAYVILFIAIFNGSPESVFVLFVIAELTDVFDGTCARKWPFPKGKEPKYRKRSAWFDMYADASLAGAEIVFLTLRVNWFVGLIFIIYYIISAFGVDLLVYGKILGHPDDCTKNSLVKKNFPLAKKIILTRRYIYTLCLGIVTLLILCATSWPNVVKYSMVVLGCAIFVFAWFFLRQRRHNISRDAVKIEKELTQKSQKR